MKANKAITVWTDAWRVYEDVCLVCAGLWIGNSLWKGASPDGDHIQAAGPDGEWGPVRLEGDDDLKLNGMGMGYIRSVGMGIEGGPASSNGGSGGDRGNSMKSNIGGHSRRSKGASWSSGKATLAATISSSTSPKEGADAKHSKEATGGTLPSINTTISSGKQKQPSSIATSSHPVGSSLANKPSSDFEPIDPIAEAKDRRDVQLRTTLALLQTFHANTLFQLSVLESFLPAKAKRSSADTSPKAQIPQTHSAHPSPPPPLTYSSSSSDDSTIVLHPRDILLFELSPISGADARYLDWLAQEYADGVKIVVKRSWRDLLSLIIGYG